MNHSDDLICLHRSLHIVRRWYESFFVLRNDDVMITLYANHWRNRYATWRNRYNDSYCMNHAVWVIILLKRLCFELIQVKNQFNQLVRQFNRGRKPSGWKAHVRFSGKIYRVRLYSTTRWRKISIKKFSLSFYQGCADIFQTGCFNFFPTWNLTSLVSLERGDSALSYEEVSKKISMQKKFYGS